MTQKIITILILLAFTGGNIQAQFWKKKKTKEVELNSDTVSIEITNINFHNINKVTGYVDKKTERKIQKLDQEEN